MPKRLDRQGSTLTVAVIAIALLSLTVAAAVKRTSSERRINADQHSQVTAVAVAQSGLERYRAGITVKPGTSHDTTITSLPGGTAQVSLRRVRDAVVLAPALYLVTARATSTTAVGYDAAAPTAQRSVGQYMNWLPATLDLNAAFTSLSGIDKNGNSGALDGNDGCAGTGTLPIPGVAVPTGTYTGQTTPINGVPDDTPVPLGTPGTSGTAKDEVDVDWAGIVAGTAFPPTVTLPGGSWPDAAGMNNWPVIFNNGDLSVGAGTTNSKGILIVTGNFTMGGSFMHEGLVLVGGTLTSNGNNVIQGALITGLNVKLGIAVPQTAISNGNKTFQYNSCALFSALSTLGTLEPIRNGWSDDYPSY